MSNFPEGTRVRYQTNNDDPGREGIVLDPKKEGVPSWKDMVYVRHSNGEQFWYEACFLIKLAPHPYRESPEEEVGPDTGKLSEAQEKGETWVDGSWLLTKAPTSKSGREGEEMGLIIEHISTFRSNHEKGYPHIYVKSTNGDEVCLFNITKSEFISLLRRYGY